jgi:hypothetical protein
MLNMNFHRVILTVIFYVLVGLIHPSLSQDDDIVVEPSRYVETCLTESELSEVHFPGRIFYSVTDGTNTLHGIRDNLQPELMLQGIEVAGHFGYTEYGNNHLMIRTTRHQDGHDYLDTILVIDVDGEVLHQFSWQEKIPLPHALALDGRFIISYTPKAATERGFGLMTLDGEIDIYINLPNLFWDEPVTRHSIHMTLQPIQISPTGEHVVYDALVDSEIYPDDERVGLIMFDTATQTEIWSTTHNFLFFGRLSTAKWAPDGTQFAYARANEEYGWYPTAAVEIGIVDQDGVERIVTNIGAQNEFFIPDSELFWSPDGSKIAFWMWDFEQSWGQGYRNDNKILHYIDLIDNTVYNLCLVKFSGAEVTWSPDSTMMIYDNYETITLVDLEQSTYVDMPQDPPVAYILGWLDE